MDNLPVYDQLPKVIQSVPFSDSLNLEIIKLGVLNYLLIFVLSIQCQAGYR